MKLQPPCVNDVTSGRLKTDKTCHFHSSQYLRGTGVRFIMYFLLFIKNPAYGRGLEATYHLDFWISSSTHNLDRSACNACRMHAELSKVIAYPSWWWGLIVVHQEPSSNSIQAWAQFWQLCMQTACSACRLHAHLSKWSWSHLPLIDPFLCFWPFCPLQHAFSLPSFDHSSLLGLQVAYTSSYTKINCTLR